MLEQTKSARNAMQYELPLFGIELQKGVNQTIQRNT
jgi:hypothetical protein